MLRPLDGFTVGITADRRAEEQAELLRRRGATVVAGPSIRTVPLVDGEALAAATRAVIARPPDVVVLTTGLGTRGWLAAAEGMGLDEALLGALRRARVVARGPKAAGAAVAAGLQVAWQAPSERVSEVVAALAAEGVAGADVVVQRDGGARPTVADALASLGARALDVPVYRWAVPDDIAPAVRLVQAACAGRLDAVTFTSSPAVENLVATARELGLAAAFAGAFARHGVVAACVGPVCAETALRCGIPAVVQPARARLGAMVQALVTELGGRRIDLRLDGVPLTVQGATAAVGTTVIRMSARERAVLDVLARRPGQVVAKGDLLERLWGDGDLHTVEVTVARLRRRLGPAGHGLRTVPRRGYLLDVSA